MLSIRTLKAHGHALAEYLRQADYYSEGMKVEGYAHGKLCEAVGLSEGASVSDDAFERIAGNRHAVTGEKLTSRMAAGRRAGFDAVFNAPKSVSIQAFVGGDERLVAAHSKAVAEALTELERFAAHQTGRGIDKRYAEAGAIAAAVFCHGESRALDPHLHSHAFIFNVTRHNENPKRLMALESSPIFERTKFLTEVYRNALAREVRHLGYEIERRSNGFELTGVSRDICERFSKRAQEREKSIAEREMALGRTLTRNEVAELVRENRAQKQYQLTPQEVRQKQLSQISETELRQLQSLSNQPAQDSPPSNTLAEKINATAEHVFERKTVVAEHEFLREALRQGYGEHSLPEVKAALNAPGHGLLRSGGQITTQEALDLERDLVIALNEGVAAASGAIGFMPHTDCAGLTTEQRNAVDRILASRDTVSVLRGRAGTGKTLTVSALIEGTARYGQKVACFAPSTQAVDVLRRDGIAQDAAGRARAGQSLRHSETVQRLLVDTQLQESLRNQTIIVDEYGLLSTRQLKSLVDIAAAQKARLVLVGDSAQHKSVEAGDAARIVETETKVRVVTLKEVHRQRTNPAYKAAAQSLAAGDLAAGVKKLDRMGAVVEITFAAHRQRQMVDEWHAVVAGPDRHWEKPANPQPAKTALMVAPTWAEIDQLNVLARNVLKADRTLNKRDQPFVALRSKDWTAAQQKEVRNYAPGDILVARKSTKHYVRGDEMRVVRRDGDRLVARLGHRELSLSPRQAGLTWTPCNERATPVAAGEVMRVRAVAEVLSADGTRRRLANGSSVTVKSVTAAGQLVLQDNSILCSREIVYGYAVTSHASQGMTVDRVFMAGAATREGLYVAATRAREAVRIFVPNREQFLSAAGLRSEARVSAIEFARAHLPRALRHHMTAAIRHLGYVRASVATYLRENPHRTLLAPFVRGPRIKPKIDTRIAPAPWVHTNSDDFRQSHRHRAHIAAISQSNSSGMRM